jgi:hypothetical protein
MCPPPPNQLSKWAPTRQLTNRRAKEKRERLRSAHLAPDYIPLGGAAALSNKEAAEKLRSRERSGGSGGSDSDREAEDEMRIQFLGPAKAGKQKGLFAEATFGDVRSPTVAVSPWSPHA